MHGPVAPTSSLLTSEGSTTPTQKGARHHLRVGLVGWTDGLDDGTDDLLERGVPEERWVGYLVPNGDSLTWYPPNQGAPMRAGHP